MNYPDCLGAVVIERVFAVPGKIMLGGVLTCRLCESKVIACVRIERTASEIVHLVEENICEDSGGLAFPPSC